MKSYALVFSSGIVGEVFIPTELDGVLYPVEELYTPEFISGLVDVTACVPFPEAGWSGVQVSGEWSFAPYVTPEPTAAEILASQSLKLQQFTQLAAAQKSALANRISTLNDAIELEEATPAEVSELPVRQAQLLEWKRYAIYLGRVTGQDGWPPDVEWPVQPADGMDLTVSASAPI